MSLPAPKPSCPKCNKLETVIAGKPEFGGGWVCWAKRGGCGHSWQELGASETFAAARERVMASLTPPAPPVAAEEPPHPASMTVGPPELPMSRNQPLPMPANFEVTPSELAIGAVKVVTGSGVEVFPPRTTFHIEQGNLLIKNKDGATIRVYNGACWNQVVYNLP